MTRDERALVARLLYSKVFFTLMALVGSGAFWEAGAGMLSRITNQKWTPARFRKAWRGHYKQVNEVFATLDTNRVSWIRRKWLTYSTRLWVWKHKRHFPKSWGFA